MCILNVAMNVAYFTFNYKFMFKKHTKFFSLPRIFVFFVLSQLLHEQFVVKYMAMNTYRVNINDLFDQDEEFLFESPYFRALIKKIRNQYEYLVNPIFDLEEVVKSPIPADVEAKVMEVNISR